MPLANSSYRDLPALGDTEALLNLAWTMDEQDHLDADLPGLVAAELAAEAAGGLPSVNHYAVQDPYGEAALRPVVEALLGGPAPVTCAAGVGALLHGIAALARGRDLYVVGDVYPDLPHWVGLAGGRCRPAAGAGADAGEHAAAARACGATLVLLDRPELAGGPVRTADWVRELCERVAAGGTTVVVDESYANYHPPAASVAGLAAEVGNLVVLRGLSKAYWLGGLRLGYCVTSAPLTGAVRAVLPPLQASPLSIRLGAAVLRLGDVTGRLRERTAVAKAETLRLLHGAGVPLARGAGEHLPYVLLPASDAAGRALLDGLGVLGKRQASWSGPAAELRHLYRLSVPLSPERLAELGRRLG
jgi:histidinol-phosphate/aromatic aminotransferase/cobyric acid decarboxylase-like protein